MIDRIPPRAGIGLRAQHYLAMIEAMPNVGWLEIHGENYFCKGGQPLQVLERLGMPISEKQRGFFLKS